MMFTDQDLWCEAEFRQAIEPFVGEQVGKAEGVISYGVSSYGYDFRIAKKDVRIFSQVDPHLSWWKRLVLWCVYGIRLLFRKTQYVNPKHFNEAYMYSATIMQPEECIRHNLPPGCYAVIPPYTYGMGTSVEKFKVPRSALVICLNKSSLARTGLIVNVTPLEPEWEGYVTVEFFNANPRPYLLPLGEGIAQAVFLKAHEHKECGTSYKDRKGHYQNQPQEVVAAKRLWYNGENKDKENMEEL